MAKRTKDQQIAELKAALQQAAEQVEDLWLYAHGPKFMGEGDAKMINKDDVILRLRPARQTLLEAADL